MGFFCWLTRRRLGAYHDGELGGGARSRVEAHLTTCPGCSAESGALTRLQAALADHGPEPSEAVWAAFWPQVRMRLAAAAAPESSRRDSWTLAPAGPRYLLSSALAAAALAVIAVLAPWQRLEHHAPAGGPGSPALVAAVIPGSDALGQPSPPLLVQSVETADPESSVMVYASPESDLTVVWVFGLERTDT